MIYDTAKELEKLKIDWTAGAQGLQMVCKHYPNRCPSSAGTHKEGELAEWPPLEEMIAECRDLNKKYADTFKLAIVDGKWTATMDNVFTATPMEWFYGVGDEAREATAMLLVAMDNRCKCGGWERKFNVVHFEGCRFNKK